MHQSFRQPPVFSICAGKDLYVRKPVFLQDDLKIDIRDSDLQIFSLQDPPVICSIIIQMPDLIYRKIRTSPVRICECHII